MNKKRLCALLLFGCLVIAFMFLGVTLMINYNDEFDFSQMNKAEIEDTKIPFTGSISYAKGVNEIQIKDNPFVASSELLSKDYISPLEELWEKPWLSNAPLNEKKEQVVENTSRIEQKVELPELLNIKGGKFLVAPERELIIDHTKVDYEAYIPMLTIEPSIEELLNIENPNLAIKAEAAILIDIATGEILYSKNAVEPIFPASTAKLLTAMTALDWCDLEEEVTIGQEIRMIASDSTRANLYPGEILTIENLLEGMLLPSGNDAAYALATYVGRISLRDRSADPDKAVTEFVRLMNQKAKKLGALYSNFKTPDGYDALGQYTTAYDMGIIGIAATKSDIIMKITCKSSSRNRFVSGEDVTWHNTNSLISKSSGRYYEYCEGLKTGTSTMAGKCLISAGKKNSREVLSVVMNSTSAGRWSDTITLLDYGLSR